MRDVVYQGSFKRIVALPTASPDIEVLCRVPSDLMIAAGDKMGLRLPPERLVVLKG